MSCRVIDNNAYELDLTPSRKRKRDCVKLETVAISHIPATAATASVVTCFTNAAFSSTPKKQGKRQLHKENLNPFLPNPCLEVKSIAELMQEQPATEQQECDGALENPFEVVRKPPKKKKKHFDAEQACFENAALNLEQPEKQFNPFEVQRAPVVASKCFSNAALNLRGQDVPATRNPFEIPRCSAVSISAANPAGVENFAMDAPPALVVQPSHLQIGLPFAPTLGCRIDFKNMPLSQLTPSKLLAEKLVFSPVPGSTKTPKRSMRSIGEESMDIGKELDRYQLELENSINEAKVRKHCGGTALQLTEEVVLEVEQKVTFTQKLTEISECEEELDARVLCEEQRVQLEESKTLEAANISCIEPPAEDTLPLLEAPATIAEEKPMLLNTAPCKDETEEELEDEEDDDDLDFKAPAPFVRAYRRAEPPTAALTVSKESLNSVKSDNSDHAETKKHTNVKTMLRNSIRKLMHPHAVEHEKLNEKQEEAAKHNAVPTSIMSSIRHSLRRKPQKPTQQSSASPEQQPAELSIIDSSERTMKLKSNMAQTDYAQIEELTNERKHGLRNSIRKSTREVRQQFMKTVFHKNQEEYAFRKNTKMSPPPTPALLAYKNHSLGFHLIFMHWLLCCTFAIVAESFFKR